MKKPSAMIVLPYALLILGVVCWSIERMKQVETPPKVEEHQLADTAECMPIDTVELNIPLLIPEEPYLLAQDTIQADTLRALPQRYPTSMMQSQGRSNEVPTEYLYRTDLLGDFINRFNGDSATLARLGEKIDFTFGGTQTARKGMLLLLVNKDYPHRDSTLMEFAEEVINSDSLMIDEETGRNMAAVVTFAYSDLMDSNKRFPIRLTLRRGVVEDAPVWYIMKAESPYFTYGEKEKPYYIDAAEPEVKFMGLGSYTNRSAESLTGKENYEGNGLAAYLLLTSKGFIKYEYSERAQFVFRTGNWQFLVEHVESFEHRRSGYLITRIAKDGMIVFENHPLD